MFVSRCRWDVVKQEGLDHLSYFSFHNPETWLDFNLALLTMEALKLLTWKRDPTSK
jgi:hypothetical protein